MAKNPVAVYFQNSIYGVGSVFFDLIESEEHSYNNSVSAYNIEDGSTISDNIKNELIEGSLSGIISNFSINSPGLVSNRAQDGFDALVRLWKARELVDVYTVHKIYESMAITSVRVNKAATDGEVLLASVSFKEMKVVQLQETSIEANVKIKDMDSTINKQAAVNKNLGTTVSK